jgi:hypothetical protein
LVDLPPLPLLPLLLPLLPPPPLLLLLLLPQTNPRESCARSCSE